MATQSHKELVNDSARAFIGKGDHSLMQYKAHHMLPILMGTDVTAASTKVITVTGILATDVVFGMSLDAGKKIINGVCTANTITLNADTTVTNFQYLVLRPTAPVV